MEKKALVKKYKKYVENILWHIDKNNPPEDAAVRMRQRVLDYQEIIKDLESIPASQSSPSGAGSVDGLRKSLEEMLWAAENGEAEAQKLGRPRYAERLEMARAALSASGTGEEWIICSAIRYKGGVITGRRHSDCYETLKQFSISEDNFPGREHQGFVTSKNRYVDRREAWNIAVKANQIKYGKDSCNALLISENLY